MTIYLSFLVQKIAAIVHATPTNARPTPSAWNHEHDRVSDFVPIASLLEWQWHQIVMRNGQFYHSSRNGASQTAQCQEIPHSFPEPFYPMPVSEWTMAIIITNAAHGVTMVIFKMVFSGRSLDRCSSYNLILFAL